MKLLPVKFLFGFVVICLTSVALAQSDNRTLAMVNGVKITSAQLDQFVLLATAQGAKDTPELRQNFLNDLVVREAIAQDVKRTGLLSKGNNGLKLKIAEQDAVMGLWFSQYLADHPITEAEVKAEYEKQVAVSKDPKNAKEYQISQIVLPSEAEAQQVISQLKGGASFEVLAKDRSMDKVTSKNGGSVGWVLPTQLSSPINEIVTSLRKGEITTTPIQFGSGWYIVKVDDIKPFVLLPFDQAKANIANAMLQNERRVAVDSLIKATKIIQGAK